MSVSHSLSSLLTGCLSYSVTSFDCRLYCHLHHKIYHRQAGFGNYQIDTNHDNDENQNENMSLIIAKQSYHKIGSAECYHLQYKFMDLTMNEKRAYLLKLMRQSDASFDAYSFSDTKSKYLLLAMGISIFVCIFPYLWAVFIFWNMVITDDKIMSFIFVVMVFYSVLLVMIMYQLRIVWKLTPNIIKIILTFRMDRICAINQFRAKDLYARLIMTHIILDRMQSFDIAVIVLSYLFAKSWTQ